MPRLNNPTPTVIDTHYVPLDESFFIETDGQTEQWFYDNETLYAPNRKLTPLTLTPRLGVFDKDTNTSYSVDAGTVSFQTVVWYALDYNPSTEDYAETVITNVTDSASADYVLNGNSLIVKKNVSYSHGVTIRCVANYRDPRDAGRLLVTQASVLLTTNRDAKVVLPEVAITSPSARAFNPLTDYDGQGIQQSQFEFKAAFANNTDNTATAQVLEYRVDGGGTEELVEAEGVMTALPAMDIRYPDSGVMNDQSFLYRVTAGGTKPNVDGTAHLMALRGSTAKFNQLVPNPTNEFVISSASYVRIINGTYNFLDHKVYVRADVKKTTDFSAGTQGIKLSQGGNMWGQTLSTSSIPADDKYHRTSKVLKSSNTSNNCLVFQLTGTVTGSATATNVVCIDLTALFGTDAQIASALDIQTSDITTSVGVAAFESWLTQNFGERSYYAYNAGSLVPTRFEGIRTTGTGWTRTASLPITTLTGKLNAAGESVVVFPDGMNGINNVRDELKVSAGAVVAEKRIQKVDLGDCTYTKQGDLYVTANVTPASDNMLIGQGNVSRWRQLLNTINDSTTSGYRSYYSSGTIYINNASAETPKATNLSYFSGLAARVVIGHKYAIFADTDDYNAYLTINFGSSRNPYLGNTITFTSAPTSTIRLRINTAIPAEILPVGGTISLKIGMFDLTDIFGSGNEPATVADFKSWLTTNAGTTTDCFAFLANGIAITNAGTYADAAAFKQAMAGVPLYYELPSVSEYVMDSYSLPANFVWFGMNNGVETRVEQLPYYVSGQGTDTLTVDAMWSENINVVLRCTKNAATDELSPSKAYAAVTWRIPDVDTHTISDNGGAVRGGSSPFLFSTICNVNGVALSDAVKDAHLRFNWMYRKSNLTVENDLGWGSTMNVPADFLMNVRTPSGTLPSTHVYTYPYVLGAWEEGTPDRLPAGYTEMDYLESTGTQYINTGILPDSHTGFEVKLQIKVSVSDGYIFGARQGTNGRLVVGSKTSSYYLAYGAQTTVMSYSTNPLNNAVVARLNYLDSGQGAINASTYNITGSLSSITFTNSYISMFGRMTDGAMYLYAQKVFYAIITSGSEIIAHFVPALRDSDSVPGMYDLVNNTFLTNAGTGEFICGPIHYKRPTMTKNGVTYIRTIE